jgi:threonylcarbamoyladenosine tRNA methylthiotransferase MtaB
MPTLKTFTLGCKVNQYETEYLRQGLAQLDYRDAADGEAVDLCLVNTCTVTADGEAKSRKAIRRFARRYPQAEIVVMGCYAARAAEEVARLPGVGEVIADKRELPEFLARRGLSPAPTGIAGFGSRQRACVKVQDGCRMGCSYCIIPLVRPVVSSRPPRDVLEEIRRLVDNGHREVVLTGIHLGHYGVDLSGAGVGLAGLLRQIVELEGEFRVRISSLEAAEATAELIAVMAARPDRVCPHLHLSMQSGSDAVLRRMRRRWPTARLLRRCEQIRRRLDRPALTTDLIVGFPGETDKDFAATCRAVEAGGFSKLHVFRFSPREGTPAAQLPGRVPGRVVRQRAAELARLGRRLGHRYFENLLRRELQVLVEEQVAGCLGRLRGTSDRYVPVEFTGPLDLVGRLVQVSADSVAEGRIDGTHLGTSVPSPRPSDGPTRATCVPMHKQS